RIERTSRKLCPVMVAISASVQPAMASRVTAVPRILAARRPFLTQLRRLRRLLGRDDARCAGPQPPELRECHCDDKRSRRFYLFLSELSKPVRRTAIAAVHASVCGPSRRKLMPALMSAIGD